MAEAATVIQLIQFSGLVLTCCYDYIDKAKRAPKEIQNVIDETNSIKNLLERLQGIASNPNDDRFVILKSLNRENGPFQACSSALAELDEKLKALTDASTVRRHLQWPLEAKGIEKILGRLEKLKSEFYTALAGDTAILTDSIQDTVEEVRETVQDMKAAEEKNRILMWLDGPDPSINHNSAKSKREPGTCEWLVASKDFTSWFNTPATSQLLWLHAFPGAGKTILSSAVIEHLCSQPLSADYAVIYYYFDFSNASRQTYLGFLRSLVRQICARTKTVPKSAVELFDACKGVAPGSEQLLKLLKDLLKKPLRTFLIIDALDECPESEDNERKHVLAALAEIKALKAPNLSIFVASRPEVDIKQAMDTVCDIDIDVQATLTNEDIRFHIRAQLMIDPKLKRWQQSIKDEIEERLMKDAGGS
jgi:ankyrin repeat domain-containing protein 50